MAKKPISWYPNNSDGISEQCYRDNELSSEVIRDLENNLIVDDPKVHSAMLCQAKAIGVYKDHFDVKQLANTYYRLSNSPVEVQYTVQRCVDEIVPVETVGEKLFRVIECLNNIEDRKSERANK